MKTPQNGFIGLPLLALIAILLIGGGAYAYVQNKQANQPVAQTSDWKTYTNAEYGFEFKYPVGMTLGGFEKGEGGGDMPKFTTFWIDYKSANKDFLFAVYPATIYENIAQYRKNRQNTLVATTTLGGEDWYRFDERSAVQYDQYYLEKNENIYRVDIYDSKNENRLKQILSTFKFTQATSTIKGSLIGERGNWVLAEPAEYATGYSRKFALKFNDNSNCVIFRKASESFPCLSTLGPNWGVGDRVRVTGKIGVNYNSIEVVTMEIVSSLPDSSW